MCYPLERNFINFAIFVKTPSFWQEAKARSTKDTVFGTPMSKALEARCPWDTGQVPGKDAPFCRLCVVQDIFRTPARQHLFFAPPGRCAENEFI